MVQPDAKSAVFHKGNSAPGACKVCIWEVIMRINTNPFASPGPLTDTRNLPSESADGGLMSSRVAEILRGTRPAVRLLGMTPILISIAAAGVYLYIQFDILPRLDPAAQQPGFTLEFAVGAMVCMVVCSALIKSCIILYISIGWAFRGYAKSIKVALDAPNETNMIAALDSHRRLLKVSAILALTMVVLSLLLGVGALVLLGWRQP